MRTFRTTIAD